MIRACAVVRVMGKIAGIFEMGKQEEDLGTMTSGVRSAVGASDLAMVLTERGFVRAEFLDRYGAKCSIQKSSLAFEDCIWLGVDKLETPARMHLTQAHAASLIPLLQHFVDTGELPEPKQ